MWEARHKTVDGVRAVVKFMRPELVGVPHLVDRFLREASAGMKISHERLVKVYDAAVLPGIGPYIVMEYLDGVDLEEHLSKRGKLSAAETLAILAQVADGLEALHAEGIFHRDLKPSNVFLLRGEDLAVKIVDFGLAKVISPDGQGITQAGFFAGSPGYVAPEQVEDFANAGARADVFALGMTCIRMIAGGLPYDSTDSPSPLLESLSRQRAEPGLVRRFLERQSRSDIPREWFAILEKAVAFDAKQRTSCARAVTKGLADSTQGHGAARDVSNPAVTLAAGSSKESQPSRAAFWPMVAIAAPVLGTAVAIAVVVVRSGTPASVDAASRDASDLRDAAFQSGALINVDSGVDAERQRDVVDAGIDAVDAGIDAGRIRVIDAGRSSRHGAGGDSLPPTTAIVKFFSDEPGVGVKDGLSPLGYTPLVTEIAVGDHVFTFTEKGQETRCKMRIEEDRQLKARCP